MTVSYTHLHMLNTNEDMMKMARMIAYDEGLPVVPNPGILSPVSYTHLEVLMCACNNKEMHTIQEAVKKVDSSAFLVTMASNEVRGKGFKPI